MINDMDPPCTIYYQEKWGLELVWRTLDTTLSLEIAVTRVGVASPAHRAGIRPGHVITLVNDWNIEVNNSENSIS